MTTQPTTDEFLSLIVQSGLLPAERLSPYRSRSGDDAVSAESVARTLVKDRLLTLFQARLLLKGKFRGFFLTEKFKVLELLGEGGMGKVLLCEHLVLHKLVAVKLLHATADNAPGMTERFLREARASAAVDHPNLVRVVDVDRAGPTPFMVMEYVDGTNLHQLITGHGPLPVNRAIEYTRQAAVGLHAAHMAGLIHRDIKPGNLMLARNGLVKLADLGLARFMRNVDENQNLTARFDDNAILGTADFIAPEQTMNSSAVDIRADIYSLGHTLYFLLTGRMPFGDGTAAQKLVWHQMRQPEPVSTVRREVPASVQAVLSKMIEKRPADRYQTPAEVVEALRPLLAGPVPPPPAAEMPKVRPSSYMLGLSPPPAAYLLSSNEGNANTPDPSAGNTPQSLWGVRPGSGTRGSGQQQQSGSGEFTGAPRGPRTGHGMPATIPTTAPLSSPFDTDPPPGSATFEGPPPRRPWGIIGSLAAAVVGLLGLCLYLGGVFDSAKPPRPTNPGMIPPPPKKDKDPEPPPPKTNVTILGGGSTFVNPLMKHWASLYEKQTGVKIDYRGGGSSAGVDGQRQWYLDFGCSDAPLTAAQLEQAKVVGGEVLHVPLVQGAVVPIYKLPGVKAQLQFTGPVLAQIYLGKITHWDDKAITISNPDAADQLPHLPIIPVRRSDGSGTTFIWTDYLSKIDPAEFGKKVGASNKPEWPKNADGKDITVAAAKPGNDGIAEEVNKQVGTIGYVELTFALTNGHAFGKVKNSNSGDYVDPSLESVTAAATASATSAPDFRYSLTNSDSPAAYPIVGTTWAIIYVNPKDPAKGKELINFLRWCAHDGQNHVKGLKYAPLPEELVKRIDVALDKLPAGR